MDNDIIINNEIKKNKRPIAIIGIVGFILIIVIALVVLLIPKTAPRYENVIHINGLNELDNSIPTNTKEDLEAQLYYLMNNNFELPEDLSVVVAEVRPQSVVIEKNGAIKSASLIIDIEEYQQSYHAVMNWSDGGSIEDGILIECTNKFDSKYPSAKCYGMNANSESIKLYLPSELTLSDEKKAEMEYGFTDENGKEIIKIMVNSCGIHSIENEALSMAKSWVRKLGFSPDDFIYKLHSGYKECIVRAE